MDRRAFLGTLAGGLLAAPLAVEAQQTDKVYRIGLLRAGAPPPSPPPPPLPNDYIEALQQGLRERGYVEGQNLVIEFPITDGSTADLPRLAEELVRLKLEVILAVSASPALAAKKATTSVPIVLLIVYDPVELGLIQSLGRPGGNITGLAVSSADLFGKRLELLRGLVPRLRRVAVLRNPANPSDALQFRGVEVAARTLGIQLKPVLVRSPDDLDPRFRATRGADGLLVLDDPLFSRRRVRLAALAASSRLPAIYGEGEIVAAGGLVSYGANFPDIFRRAATFADKILKGAKPADLPIERATKFELIINLKTAKALGLTIPQSVLLRADQVIE